MLNWLNTVGWLTVQGTSDVQIRTVSQSAMCVMEWLTVFMERMNQGVLHLVEGYFTVAIRHIACHRGRCVMGLFTAKVNLQKMSDIVNNALLAANVMGMLSTVQISLLQ